MGHEFRDFMRGLEEEARREGPEAVCEAAALKAQFKLAAELILLRGQRGFTRRELSGWSGVQQSAIARIEGGRANPSLSTLTALARALGAELAIRIQRRNRVERRVGPACRRAVGTGAH